jgi:hypothetical protein
MGLRARAAGLFDHDDPNSLVSRLRRRRSQVLREIIEDVAATHGVCRVLAVGGEAGYWLHIFGADWLRSHGVEVTLLNHTDEYVGTPDPGLFSIVITDACHLPYEDHSFDLVHSNSVIEHVGDWERQRAFAEEILWVGLHYYLQTPARCFPLEPHVRFPWFQYLPSAARIWLFQHIALGSYPRVSREQAEAFDHELQLLTRRQLAALFPAGTLSRERLFGLTKSYMVRGSLKHTLACLRQDSQRRETRDFAPSY